MHRLIPISMSTRIIDEVAVKANMTNTTNNIITCQEIKLN